MTKFGGSYIGAEYTTKCTVIRIGHEFVNNFADFHNITVNVNEIEAGTDAGPIRPYIIMFY